MANKEHIQIFKKGEKVWNKWRMDNPQIIPDLSNISFFELYDSKGIYYLPEFCEYNLSNADLRSSELRNCFFTNVNFDDAYIVAADLCYCYFGDCSFKNANLRLSKLGSAQFHYCNFENSDLAYASAEESKFIGSKMLEANLQYIKFIKTDFTDALLDHCKIYGISSWDIILENTKQKDLLITLEDEPIITVDNLEIAQFIYLLIYNSKLRSIIDTITSKVVLILGRFTAERKKVLEKIKEGLRQKDYLPVMFDFEGPNSRDVNETISLLAHLSKFIIADITDAKSIPQELQLIIPNLLSVPIQPLLQLDKKEYGMFEHFKKYPSVIDIKYYKVDNLDNIIVDVILSCENKLLSLNTS